MQDAIHRVFDHAVAAIAGFDNFAAIEAAVALLHTRRGATIISAIGKSGLVGQKTAATMRSLGRNAFFIHAAEASHGDLGCFDGAAVAIVFSHSGETTELSDLVNFCREQAVPLVAITAQPNSTIAKAASVAIAYGTLREADLDDLAPTTSTSLMAVIGDALALGDAAARNFRAHEFARLHPRGRLGARLKTVGEIMHQGAALPTLPAEADMARLVVEITSKALGIAVLLEGEAIYGVITDGDLRRHLDGLMILSPRSIATRQPKTITPDAAIAEAVARMTQAGITQLLVVDGGENLRGIVHLHDCLAL